MWLVLRRFADPGWKSLFTVLFSVTNKVVLRPNTWTRYGEASAEIVQIFGRDTDDCEAIDGRITMFRWGCYALTVLLAVWAGALQAQIQVNTYNENQQTDPAVAMNDTGAFVVVWRSHVADGRGGGLYARRFDADGVALGEEFRINVGDIDVANWTPAVAMGSAGSFVVAWPTRRDGDSDIVARIFDADGVATTEELPVSVSPDAVASSPNIAMNASGRFVVVWTDRYGDVYLGRTYVYGRVFDADGTPITGEFEVGERTQQMWPDVTMDDAGRFVVTWIRMGDTYNRPYGEYIMMRLFNADGTPSAREVPLTDDLNSRWYGPAVAGSTDGGFVVTWAVGPFPYDVCAQPFDSAGVPISPPYIVNTWMEGNQGHPHVASNGDTEYLVVWDCHGDPGAGCTVRGQFCTSDGQIEGEELVMNGQETCRNWYPDVAMAADGRYVVAWVGENLDGSGYGICATVGRK